MNYFTLRFKDPELEQKYFEDQFEGLLTFYRWIVVLGSASAVMVIFMEFVSPFGFGVYTWLLTSIPFSFVSSYYFIKRIKKLFNVTLALMNLSLGFFVDVLLIMFMGSEILFLAGQTVALVQFGFLLGTNFTVNVVIFCFNNISMMVLDSYFKHYFKSLQTMLLLALVMMIISYWTSEKMKREFFLLKYQDAQMQNSFDSAFKINILRCHYNVQETKIQFLNGNKQSQTQFKIDDQEKFTQFIRNNQLVDHSGSDDSFLSSRSKSITQRQQIQKSFSLEQFIYYMFTNPRKCAQIHHKIYGTILTQQKGMYMVHTNVVNEASVVVTYKIQVFLTVLDMRQTVIIMIQDDDTNTGTEKKNTKAQLAFRFLRKLQDSVEAYITKSAKKIKDIQRGKLTYREIQNKSCLISYQLLRTLLTSHNIMIATKRRDLKLNIMKFKLASFMESLEIQIGDYLKMKNLQIISIYPNETVKTDYKLFFHVMMNFIVNFIDNVYESKESKASQMKIEMKTKNFFEEDLLLSTHLPEDLKEIKILSVRLMQKMEIQESKYFQSRSQSSMKNFGLGIEQNLQIIENIGPEKVIQVFEQNEWWIQEFSIFQDLEVFQKQINSNVFYEMYRKHSKAGKSQSNNLSQDRVSSSQIARRDKSKSQQYRPNVRNRNSSIKVREKTARSMAADVGNTKRSVNLSVLNSQRIFSQSNDNQQDVALLRNNILITVEKHELISVQRT